MSNEIWKPIRWFQEGNYEVSNLGRVRNPKGNILEPFKSKGEYYVSMGNPVRTFVVARLVACQFIGVIKDKLVLHRDDNPSNNHVSNLKIVDADGLHKRQREIKSREKADKDIKYQVVNNETGEVNILTGKEIRKQFRVPRKVSTLVLPERTKLEPLWDTYTFTFVDRNEVSVWIATRNDNESFYVYDRLADDWFKMKCPEEFYLNFGLPISRRRLLKGVSLPKIGIITHHKPHPVTNFDFPGKASININRSHYIRRLNF